MDEGRSITVAEANAAQLDAWDGDEGRYWAKHAARFDRSIANHHAAFLATAAIGGADRVLDVGCGTGQTSREAARLAADGSVLGVDLSRPMLEVARRTAVEEGISNVTFEQADAQVHPFTPASFDGAIARTSAMFFGDQVAAFTNIARALRSGGHVTLMTWQALEHNEWLRAFGTALAAGREPRLPPPNAGPLSLSDPDRVRSLLGAAGFEDVVLADHRAPMWFGEDADEAATFVLGLMGWMVADLDPARRADAEGALRDTMKAHESGGGVVFDAATWLTRATRQ